MRESTRERDVTGALLVVGFRSGNRQQDLAHKGAAVRSAPESAVPDTVIGLRD